MYARKSVRLALLAAVAAFLMPFGDRLQAAPSPVIEIIAKDNAFKIVGSKKPVITVKPGDVLKFKITAFKGQEADADGAVHSLTIKELKDQGWDIRLHEGTKMYTLVAPQEEGEYTFECVVKCGDGHDDMHGKLIVKSE